MNTATLENPHEVRAVVRLLCKMQQCKMLKRHLIKVLNGRKNFSSPSSDSVKFVSQPSRPERRSNGWLFQKGYMMAKKKKKKAVEKKEKSKGILATWAEIFVANTKSRLTDAQILVKMKAAFPEQAAKSKIFSKVAAHRTMYNRGRFSHGEKPKVKSVPYEKKK